MKKKKVKGIQIQSSLFFVTLYIDVHVFIVQYAEQEIDFVQKIQKV